VDEVAFIERRRRGRIVIRGTFAGRYLDVDDTGDALGRDTVIGSRGRVPARVNTRYPLSRSRL
jgi:hypothetical protein